ncbi:hypothetical protein TREES_T100013126 [Tupaia chinensis]|uniref:Uncharacterized protein n=1 Tax=Tupaia chinensis TaxID=246437 RepID=L9KTG5_TUPCH|nr:hypothetical protein TREES_T100013126 [Tupaia chinensis]
MTESNVCDVVPRWERRKAEGALGGFFLFEPPLLAGEGAKTSPSLPAMPLECPTGFSQYMAAFISPVGLLGPFPVQGTIHNDPRPPNSVLGHLTPVDSNFCDMAQCGKGQRHPF